MQQIMCIHASMPANRWHAVASGRHAAAKEEKSKIGGKAIIGKPTRGLLFKLNCQKRNYIYKIICKTKYYLH